MRNLESNDMPNAENQHPTAKRMRDYASGILLKNEQIPLEQHLLTCSQCRKVVERFDEQRRNPEKDRQIM